MLLFSTYVQTHRDNVTSHETASASSLPRTPALLAVKLTMPPADRISWDPSDISTSQVLAPTELSGRQTVANMSSAAVKQWSDMTPIGHVAEWRPLTNLVFSILLIDGET